MRIVFALALGAVVAEPAMAQQAPASAPDDNRDVVVITGVGPARASDELIASTSVLTETDIVERLSGGLGDTLAGLPGVSSSSFAPGASRPIIRGMGAERVQVLTNGIGVVDASAASPDHAVTADPLGAERIEILRGPASLAYGGGATGGVVNVIDGLIVDRLPDDRFSGLLYAGATSVDDGRQVAGRLTGVAGPLVGVLHGSWSEADDIDIPGFALSDRARAAIIASGGAGPFTERTLPNSASESETLSGGLSWIGDHAFLGVGARHLENEYGIVAEEDVFISMEQDRYDLRGGLRFDGPVTEITASGSTVDYTHTEFEGPGNPGTIFYVDGWEARLEARHARFAGVEGSFGAQASSRDIEAIGSEALLSPTSTKQAGVFAYETFEPDVGDWGLEGGLRYDEVTLDNVTLGEREFETLNASFGAHIHLTDQWFLGGSISRTERAPTDVELFANGPHPATAQFEEGDPTMDTEKGVNYEASLRWEGSRTHAELSVYRFDFEDFIYLADVGGIFIGDPLDPVNLPIFRYTQADAHFTGAELTGGVEWGDWAGAAWRSDASFSTVRAELDSGGDLPRIPAATAMLGLEAERDAMDARVELEYGAEQDHVALFEAPTDDYLVFNASFGVDLTDSIRLMLEARNLTDEEVRLHASPLKEIAPQPGRNFRAALRAKF